MKKIIPAVNYQSVELAIKAINQVNTDWYQLDIADGSFTNGYKTWLDPEFLNLLPDKKYELHYMLLNPEETISPWLTSKIQRVVVHLESSKNLNKVIELAKGKEIYIALLPETDPSLINEYKDMIDGVQFLAVSPGLSGQKFNEKVLKGVSYIKQNYPKLIIEIDGGVNEITGKLCLSAGANILVVGSYIFNTSNPENTLLSLKKLLKV
ncbi:MAG: hypothetical protein COU06_02385 [Candidatus Harrisonbacteria bacterium CG10_big_fil_rev_8_21_14_0_10_38_8]|uniref:Ribulose-phosphate 3-epimerase n=1 Tax=Candidatus Harrisonbacteria bacterium CG10_big_fil_rev_8_21_14_0_10_38_8 TaxID=1974582 RepID=A0A2M6WJR3_9BACT|nr:MAG: hypothetical protein COU06_02385 [Candidatus Harrisonbacteria bacterium CG10_big_fil_rev_8_21_14_0_10_38_8]